jgi:hypothetical protein
MMALYCSFKSYNLGYKCIVKPTKIIQLPNEVKSIHGNHQDCFTSHDVSDLVIENSSVNFIPKGLNTMLPNLTAVYVINCGLKTVSREDLVGFKNVETLCLTKNELTSLPDDLFRDMPKLKRIFCENNKIEYMSSKLLKSIEGNELDFVDFRGNTNIDDYFAICLKGISKSMEELMQIIDAQCLETH